MLLQIKIYLIAILYFFGTLFMFLFPPRNFVLSGAKLRTVRSTKSNVCVLEYMNPKSLLSVVERFAHDSPEVASVVRLLPLTAENRTVVALELRSDRLSKKPGILIVGALNGMAWGVPNAILDLAEKLLYDSSYQTPFFNDYDWYLIPSGNPDGLHFTQSMQALPPLDIKLWSKNLTARNSTRPDTWHKNVDVDKAPGKDPCFGTNINRNFAFHWQDDVHKTPERCSQFYPGITPFSSAEAQAIRRYVDHLGDSIHLAIHLHASFVPKKEYILYPWRYSLRQPSQFKALQEIGEYAARQARLPDGRLYEVYFPKRALSEEDYHYKKLLLVTPLLLSNDTIQVHQSSSDERVAGSFSDYVSGVVGIDLVYIIKPYHTLFPNISDPSLGVYMKKAVKAVFSLVRGWRSSTKQNTLSFFGRDIEF